MSKLTEEWSDILKEAVDRQEVGGVSLLFLKDGKEVCWLGEGYADRENKITIARDTISRLYSMTKPVTAAAAMLLAESGELELDTPVGEYLPGFKIPGSGAGIIRNRRTGRYLFPISSR